MDVASAVRPFEPDETQQGFAQVRWPLCPSPQHAEQAVEPLTLQSAMSPHEPENHHVKPLRTASILSNSRRVREPLSSSGPGLDVPGPGPLPAFTPLDSP